MAIVLLSTARTYVAADLAFRATNDLRSDLARHCLNLDVGFHEDRSPGELIERVDADASALTGFFSGFVVSVVGNALLLIGALLVLFNEAWWLGAALAIFCVVMVVLMARVRGWASPHYRATLQAAAVSSGFVAERLTGVEDIATSGAVPYVVARFEEVAGAAFRTGRRAQLYGDSLGGLMTALLSLVTSGALAAGVYLFESGRATVGTVYVLFSYAQMLTRPLRVASDQANQIQRVGAAAVRARELRSEPFEVPTGTIQRMEPGAASVEFEGVSFSYGNGPLVLKDLTFSIAAGEVVGVLGRTGAGKTSIAKLIYRLYDPTIGRILLSGHDLRSLSNPLLRSAIGVVTQNVQLFDGTIRENLTFFDPAIADSALSDAIEDLGLLPWFGRLPDGLDTVIGSRSGGVDLSAGEAQLLALTRVFLREPRLVVLDEASSRLDPATEAALESAIDRLLAGRTAFVIAHRLSTLDRVDTIMVVEGGVLVEHGPRSALAASDSRFAALLAADHSSGNRLSP